MHHPPFGHIRRTYCAPPAVATDFTLTVPTGVMWRPISITFQFDTDANVANRAITLLFTDGTNPIGRFPHWTAHPAGATIIYTASTAPVDAWHDFSFQRSIPLPPDLWLLPTYTIESATANIQVGDQISIVHLLVEEWIQP